MSRRVNAKGRNTSTPNKKYKIEGPFVPITKAMLESPAWRVLRAPERRLLDALCHEHMSHAGLENGSLIRTYDQLVEWGINRGAIKPSLEALKALGFIVVERQGRKRYGASKCNPSLYRLTFLPTPTAKPTDDWKKIKSTEQAELVREKVKQPYASGKSKKSPVQKPPLSPVSIAIPKQAELSQHW